MLAKDNFEKPIVLTIAAHDPTGGAGIQADIETISANHCYPITSITALTQQTLTTGVLSSTAQTSADFHLQLRSMLNEFQIAAIKIGVIANQEQLHIIISLLKDLKIPIVLDPVIHSTSGFTFYDSPFIDLLINDLFPICSVITPNKQELVELYKHSNTTTVNDLLNKTSCGAILITSDLSDDKQLTHRLISSADETSYTFEKLPGEYHGSGCTLSSAIAAQLAHQESLNTAIQQALEYTWKSLKTAHIEVNNIFIPNRFSNIP